MRQWGAYGVGILGVAASISAGSSAEALPSGGTVIHGGVTITSPTSNQLEINQTTDRAIIHWSEFSISPGGTVRFNQPGANSAVLNRVTGGVPSSIAGEITAPGWVFLINPDGIGFLNGAQVNVGGLVASTLNISNSDFLAGGGSNPFIFNRTPSNFGSGITIANGANITAERGALFVAPGWENKGSILVNNGIIGVAVGDTVQLNIDLFGNGLLNLSVEETIAQNVVDINGNPLKAYINQQGQLRTQSAGNIALVAHSNQDLVATALRNVVGLGNVIEAKSGTLINGEVVVRGLGKTAVQSEYTTPSTLTANQVEITGSSIKLNGTQIQASENISLGIANSKINDLVIQQAPIPVINKIEMNSGSIQSLTGNIDIQADSEINLGDNPISLGITGDLTIIGGHTAYTANSPFAPTPSVSLVSFSENLITSSGTNNITIQGTQAIGNIGESRTGVRLIGNIQQNKGDLTIIGQVTGFDPSTDYRTWDVTSRPYVVGVYLNGSILQEEGKISIRGEGLTGIHNSVDPLEIKQNNGSSIVLEGKGHGSQGGINFIGAEGYISTNISADNSQINIKASNTYNDSPSIYTDPLGIYITGNNSGVQIDATNIYSSFNIQTSNKDVQIRAKNINVVDSFNPFNVFETRILNENSNIILEVQNALGSNFLNLSTTNGDILLSADQVMDTVYSLTMTSSGTNTLGQILVNQMDQVPLTASGDGIFQIGTRDGVGMNVNHGTGGEQPGVLNISDSQLGGISSQFQEIIFGNANATKSIVVSNDNNILNRVGQALRFENRGNLQNQLEINSSITADKITIATDGNSTQQNNTIIQANRLIFIGNGSHILENDCNTIQRVEGEGNTIRLNNSNDLIADDLTLKNDLTLETQSGILEIAGNLSIGNTGVLRGQDGILQADNSIISAKQLDIFSSKSVDLHRGSNLLDLVNAEVGGGIYIKNVSGQFGNISSGYEDIILSGQDIKLVGAIQAGTNRDKNIILEGSSAIQSVGSQLLAKGVGISVTGEAILNEPNNKVDTLAGNSASLQFYSQEAITVGTLQAKVAAIACDQTFTDPFQFYFYRQEAITVGTLQAKVADIACGQTFTACGQTFTDQDDVRMIAGVTVDNNARLVSDQQIFIEQPITAGNNISLTSGDGILQNVNGKLLTNGLEIISSAPVDLGYAENKINRLAAKINTTGEDGLILRNEDTIIIDQIGDTLGITSNSDVILETTKSIQIEAPILLGTADIFLGAKGNIYQNEDSFIEARGIGIISDGYADLRSSSNKLDSLAAKVSQGITITTNNTLEIGTVESKVNRVTPNDVDDMRQVEGIVAQNSDIIIRSPNGIIVNKAIDTLGNTTLIANQIVTNEEISTAGLGIQGSGDQTNYQFLIPVRTNRLAVENSNITVNVIGIPSLEDVTSQVNTDIVVTQASSPPPPAPEEPPVVVTPPPAPEQPPVVVTPPPAPEQPPVVVTPPPAPEEPPVVVTPPPAPQQPPVVVTPPPAPEEPPVVVTPPPAPQQPPVVVTPPPAPQQPALLTPPSAPEQLPVVAKPAVSFQYQECAYSLDAMQSEPSNKACHLDSYRIESGLNEYLSIWLLNFVKSLSNEVQ